MSYKTYSEIYPQRMSSMTKNPKNWGPSLWHYLHTVAVNYPNNPSYSDIEKMVTWLDTLFITIPCEVCRDHYKTYIEDNKLRLFQICSSGNNLFNFLVDLHNWVNIQSGKRSWSYEEAREYYK